MKKVILIVLLLLILLSGCSSNYPEENIYKIIELTNSSAVIFYARNYSYVNGGTIQFDAWDTDGIYRGEIIISGNYRIETTNISVGFLK